jgi:hypothetical protein
VPGRERLEGGAEVGDQGVDGEERRAAVTRRTLATGDGRDLGSSSFGKNLERLQVPSRRLGSTAGMPCLVLRIRCIARNQTISVSLVSAITVPEVIDQRVRPTRRP